MPLTAGNVTLKLSGGDYSSWTAFWDDLGNLTGNITLTVDPSEFTENTAPADVTENLGGYTLKVTAEDYLTETDGSSGPRIKFHDTSNNINAVQLIFEGSGTVIIERLVIKHDGEGTKGFNGPVSRIATSNITFIERNCILIGNPNSTEAYGGYGFYIGVAGAVLNIYNNIFFDFRGAQNNYTCGIYINAAPGAGSFISNNTIVDCFGIAGIRLKSKSILAENNLCHNNYVNSTTRQDFYEIGNATGYNNSSCDATAADGNWSTGSDNRINKTTSPFTDYDNDDFTLAESSDPIGNGKDLSAKFTVDLFGKTRTNWDIGACEYILPDVEEPVSVTLGLKAETGKEITAPASSKIEIGAYTGKELALPAHVTVGLDLYSELIAGFFGSVSVSLGLNAETGKELQFPVPNYPAWHEKAPKLGNESYIYSLAVYNNKLYGGTRSGGKLLEWNGTDAWVEKAPKLGDEMYIRSLAVYNNKLYGGTAPNAKLYEWNGTDAWVEKAPKLGDEKHIMSLAVYNNKLYGGTYPGGKLLEWNGTDAWVEKAPKLGDECEIQSLAVYNEKLYGGTGLNAKLYEWNGTDAWVEKAPKLGNENYIHSLVVYNNKLYGGTGLNGKLLEWNGTDAWIEKAPTLGSENYIFSLAVYNNKLYGGTASNAKLYEWGNEVLLALDAETGCFAGVEFPVEVILGMDFESGKQLTLQANPVLGLQALADLNLIKPAFALLGLDVYSEKAIVLFVLNDVLINIWEEEKRVN